MSRFLLLLSSPVCFVTSQRQNFASCLLQRNPSELQAVGLVFHVLRTPDLEGKTLTEKTMKRNGEAEGVCGGGGGGGEGGNRGTT